MGGWVQREYICLCQIASKRLEHHPELISLQCSWGLLSTSGSGITESPLMLVFSLLFPARTEDSSSCREDTVQLLQVAEKHQPQERPQPCPSRCGCSYHQVPQSWRAKEGNQPRETRGWKSCHMYTLLGFSLSFSFLGHLSHNSCGLWAPCWLIPWRGHVSKLVDTAKLSYKLHLLANKSLFL